MMSPRITDLYPNNLPAANSSSNSGDKQGNNGSSTGLLPIIIIAGVIVLLLLVCFLCAITRCPTYCVESDDVESMAGVESPDLKPSLETLDREAPAKDFAQVKEEAEQRKPGDQPAWPESYYACAICLDPLKAEQCVRRLCCGHVFHSRCIVPWYLRTKYFCPLCTLPYIPEESEESESTQ